MDNEFEASDEDLFNCLEGRSYFGVDNYIAYAKVKQNKSIHLAITVRVPAIAEALLESSCDIFVNGLL